LEESVFQGAVDFFHISLKMQVNIRHIHPYWIDFCFDDT